MQRVGKGTIGRDRDQVDSVAAANVTKCGLVFFQSLQISSTQRTGVDRVLSGCVFEIAELNPTRKWKVEFIGIEDLKEQHLVIGGAKLCQRATDRALLSTAPTNPGTRGVSA